MPNRNDLIHATAQSLLGQGYQPEQGSDHQKGQLTADVKEKEGTPRQGEHARQGQRVGRPGGAADDCRHAKGPRHDG